MKLKEYLQQHGSIEAMSKTLGISRTWLSLVVNGHQPPSAVLAIKIEAATKGKITREQLRPDLYRKAKK
jgi:DNA-binding transcriptional regulator YdaS (Cro superfamily)